MAHIRDIDISALTETQLLKLRICDLPLKIKGTWLAACVRELYRELAAKNILFRPECYLADEWLAPDEEPVIGIPFFLAHPVLTALEKRKMHEAEGEGRPECLKLLRHEAGHAINYAYKFYKRADWRKVFGEFHAEYRVKYRVRKESEDFVRHLDNHYAQCHPDEDFAETFAVWLTPGLDWRGAYAKWPAYKKLKYVDTLMAKIAGKRPKVCSGDKYWQANRMRTTLEGFYKKKHRRVRRCCAVD